MMSTWRTECLRTLLQVSVERRSADRDNDGPRARSVYPSSAAGPNDVPHGLHTELLPSRRPRGGKSGYQREREKREREEATVAIHSAPWHQTAPWHTASQAIYTLARTTQNTTNQMADLLAAERKARVQTDEQHRQERAEDRKLIHRMFDEMRHMRE